MLLRASSMVMLPASLPPFRFVLRAVLSSRVPAESYRFSPQAGSRSRRAAEKRDDRDGGGEVLVERLAGGGDQRKLSEGMSRYEPL